MKPGASLYVCHPSSWQREFQNALEAAGFEVRCQIIWAKNTFAWGFGRYKFRHEPIFYAHVAGQSDAWYGDKSQSTLWEENKPAANRLHPTMKPVELIERAVAEQQQGGRHRRGLVRRIGFHADRLRASRPRGPADGTGPALRRCHLPAVPGIYRQASCARRDGRTFDEIAQQRRQEAA